MKKIIILCMAFMFATSCKFSNEYGSCVGLYNKDDHTDENLRYEFSVRNAVWTFLGSETVFIPVVWLMYAIECPTGNKTK